MKIAKLTITAVALLLGINMAFTQKYGNDDRDRDKSERKSYNDNYERNDQKNNDQDNGYSPNDHKNGRYNDQYHDDEARIRDYRSGRSDYRRNPYDYRNLPNNWKRNRPRNFDWFSYDYNNNYDPRYGGFYDNYFPWDPNNPYDIRNNRNYYGNNRYWNGPRPNRIIIVPPSIRLFGGGSWGNNNRHRGYGHNRGRH